MYFLYLKYFLFTDQYVSVDRATVVGVRTILQLWNSQLFMWQTKRLPQYYSAFIICHFLSLLGMLALFCHFPCRCLSFAHLRCTMHSAVRNTYNFLGIWSCRPKYPHFVFWRALHLPKIALLNVHFNTSWYSKVICHTLSYEHTLHLS